MKLLSVIIITDKSINRAVFLNNCLKSLDKIHVNFEIIIIDNPGNKLGVSEARNEGTKKANGDILMFLDDDAEIIGGDFSKLNDITKNKKIGVIGPRIFYPDGRDQESARMFPSLFIFICRGFNLNNFLFSKNLKIFKDLKQKYNNSINPVKDRSLEQEIDWVIGACLIIKKEIFNNLGKFNENYTFGYEDVDLCYRAQNIGLKNIYFPEIEIKHHYTRSSAKSFISKRKIQHIYSFIYFKLVTIKLKFSRIASFCGFPINQSDNK